MIHCVIDSKDSAKYEIEQGNRQYGLPESDEMEAEGYAAEILVSLNGADCLAGGVFRVKYGENL